MGGATIQRSRLNLPRRSISYTESLSDLCEALDKEMNQTGLLSQSEAASEQISPPKQKKKPLTGKVFSYSLRGHVVMFDRWGFQVFSGSSKGKVMQNMFDY